MSGKVEARTDRLPADRRDLGASGYLWNAEANRSVAKFFTRDSELRLYRDPFANSQAWGIRLVDVEGNVYAESYMYRNTP